MANQDGEQAGQQAEEDGDRGQEERGAVLDAEVERGATRDSLLAGELLQSVQDLDPHQVHQQHGQQGQTSTKLKAPADLVERATGRRARADDNESTDDDGRQACHQEDAPEGPKNDGRVVLVRFCG